MSTSGSLSRSQWLFALGSVGLFAALFWGFDTSPSSFRSVERNRELTLRNTDVNTLIAEFSEMLSPQTISSISAIDHQLEGDLADSVRLRLLKDLAGQWYEVGSPAISGAYAEQIGSIEQTAQAWSIAGSTFFAGIEQERSEKARQYSRDGALRCFEKAVSLEPGNPDHHLNLALTYTAAPPSDNPMKGILMLRDLTEKFPRNSAVLVQLGRLAIKTGQYERAVERLQQALQIDPDNNKAICLLANTWENLGRQDLAESLQARCSNEEF